MLLLHLPDDYGDRKLNYYERMGMLYVGLIYSGLVEGEENRTEHYFLTGRGIKALNGQTTFAGVVLKLPKV